MKRIGTQNILVAGDFNMHLIKGSDKTLLVDNSIIVQAMLGICYLHQAEQKAVLLTSLADNDYKGS